MRGPRAHRELVRTSIVSIFAAATPFLQARETKPKNDLPVADWLFQLVGYMPASFRKSI